MAVISSIDSDYVRVGARAVLYPKWAFNNFGYGSLESQEVYDIITDTGAHPDTQVSYAATIDPATGFRRPNIIFVKNKYMALTPTPNEDDTVLSEWISTAETGVVDEGTWEEAPTDSFPVRTRILQLQADGDKYFARKSTFQHTLNASFAFRIQIATVDSEADEDLGTRYAAVSWGNKKWAIFFFPNRSPILAEKFGGNWVPRTVLPGIQQTSEENLGEALVVVELIRNSIVITVNYSPDESVPAADDVAVQLNLQERSNQGYYSRDDLDNLPAVSWPSGAFHFWGFGLQTAFGLSPVSYPSTAYWNSARAQLTQPRGAIGDVAQLSYRGNLNGGSITITDIDPGAGPFVRYRVTMTPASHTFGGRTWQRTPDIEAVSIWYPALPVLGMQGNMGDSGLTFERRIEEIIIDKPEQLEQASSSLRTHWMEGFPALTGTTFGGFPWMPIKLFLGLDKERGQMIFDNVFSGFITNYETTPHPDGHIEVAFSLTSGAVRAKQGQRFGRTPIPRGGMTLNQVLTMWMQIIGIPVTDYAWHYAGDLIVLPLGRAERPAFSPPAFGDMWKWHEDLCELFGLDLIHTDDGRFITIPTDLTIANPTSWRANPVEPEEIADELGMSIDVSDIYSRVVLHSKLPRKGDGLGPSRSDNEDLVFTAYAINYQMEYNIGYWAHSPIQRVLEESLDFGPTSIGFAYLAVYNKAIKYIYPRVYLNVVGDLAYRLGRLHTVRIFGGNMQERGVYKIETLKHSIKLGGLDASTAARVWRTPLVINGQFDMGGTGLDVLPTRQGERHRLQFR